MGRGVESQLTYRRLQEYSNIGCVRRAGAKQFTKPTETSTFMLNDVLMMTGDNRRLHISQHQQRELLFSLTLGKQAKAMYTVAF